MLATFDPLKALEKAKSIARNDLVDAISKSYERWQATPEDEKPKLSEAFLEKQTTLYCKVGVYTQNKDWDKLLNCLHYSNKNWRKVFEAATGLTLPLSAKGTQNLVINSFIGADIYNEYHEEIKRRSEEAELLAKQKKEEGLLAEAKATKYRYCMGGIAGTPVTVTFEEMAKDLINRGFTNLAPAGGLKTCPRYELSDGKGGFVRLRKKYEIIYVRQLIADASQAAVVN